MHASPLATEPYRVEQSLGEVPAGRLYRAIDPRSGSAVILKTVERSAFPESQWRQLLVETRRWARIDRPGFPAVYEVRETADGALVVMAPTTARPLRERLGRPFSRAHLGTWCDDLLDQLAEAHAAGIVHRHLSLDSILIDGSDRALLSGFSLTQHSADPAENVAPELPRGASPSPQTDLFAFAVTLRRVVAALPGSDAVVSDPLELVLKRASADDPGRRYQDATQLHRALRGALERTAEPAEPAAPPARPRQRRHPSVIETGKIDLSALQAAAAATFPEPVETPPRAASPPPPDAETPTNPVRPAPSRFRHGLWYGLWAALAALLALSLWWISRR